MSLRTVLLSVSSVVSVVDTLLPFAATNHFATGTRERGAAGGRGPDDDQEQVDRREDARVDEEGAAAARQNLCR